MGISGTWAQRATGSYAGASKLGTGVNPIHGIRDSGDSRQTGTVLNLYPQGEPSGAVSEALADDIDWVGGAELVADTIPGEYFRYEEERPRWSARPEDYRGATNSPAMGEQPPWGITYPGRDSAPAHPLAGPTGGSGAYIDQSHGSDIERQTAIAVFGPGVRGGWMAKQHGQVLAAEAQDPADDGYVPAINTSWRQGMGVRSLDNDRAVARGTDRPRASIRSRSVGQYVKRYAMSFGMGGGPTTPDMAPINQTVGLRRPFLLRQAATARPENHAYNSMEGRVPIARTMPADPYPGDPEQGWDVPDGGDWY
jgi:hypothetical protein